MLLLNQKMIRIQLIAKPVILAIICSLVSSLLIINVFSNSPQNIHWVFSLGFHLAVAIVLVVFGFINPNPKELPSNLMSISLGRLLASGVAFLVYSLNFPETKKWFMVHFMLHYTFFTFFEILFLIKIVNPKTSNK